MSFARQCCCFRVIFLVDGCILAPPTIFEDQNIGFNVGMASGQIENNLTADGFHAGESVSFSVNYTENPVMYFGLNYGGKPVKGFQVGFDLGVLSTGGADIQYTGEAEELAEHGDRYRRTNDEIKEKIGMDHASKPSIDS